MGKNGKGFVVSSSGVQKDKIKVVSKKREKRRFMGIRVAPEILSDIAKGFDFHIRVDSSLPEDAEFISAWWNDMERCFVLMYESEEFEEREEGSVLDFLPEPKFTIIDCPLVGREVGETYIMFPKDYGDDWKERTKKNGKETTEEKNA